jgi:hypothetical protein
MGTPAQTPAKRLNLTHSPSTERREKFVRPWHRAGGERHGRLREREKGKSIRATAARVAEVADYLYGSAPARSTEGATRRDR